LGAGAAEQAADAAAAAPAANAEAPLWSLSSPKNDPHPTVKTEAEDHPQIEVVDNLFA
jgi:hypothetical protein